MPLITNPADVITHILQHEVQHDVTDKILVSSDAGTSDAKGDVALDKMAFTVHDKQINSKKLIEGIASNTRLIPYIKNGEIHYRSYLSNPTEDNLSHPLINSGDVISYTNKRTAPEKVYTKVIVNYHYDYALKEFQATTEGNSFPDSIIDYIINGGFQSFGDLDPDTYLSSLGLKSEQEYPGGFDAHYIRKEGDTPDDDTTAIELQKFLLLWHCNQHNILKLRMPLKYIQYNIGDYVGFDKPINGVKLFGEDYSSSSPETVIRNGQQILPVWMITSLNKTLTHIDVEMIQMHNCIGELQNFPPVALINGETFFEETYPTSDSGGVAYITLDGSSSFDPDGDALSYTWELESGHSLPPNSTPPQDATETLIIQNPSITDVSPEGEPVTQTHNLSLMVTDTEGNESEKVFAIIKRTDSEVETAVGDFPYAIENLNPLSSLKMLDSSDFFYDSPSSVIGFSKSEDWDDYDGWRRRREYYISIGWSERENAVIPSSINNEPNYEDWELRFKIEVSDKPNGWDAFEAAFPLANIGIAGCLFRIAPAGSYQWWADDNFLDYGTPPNWEHALKSDIPTEALFGEHGKSGYNFGSFTSPWNVGWFENQYMYPASSFPDSGNSTIPVMDDPTNQWRIRHCHLMDYLQGDFGYTIGLPAGHSDGHTLIERIIAAGLAEDEDGVRDWWEGQLVEYTFRFCVGVKGVHEYGMSGYSSSGDSSMLLLPELGYLDVNIRHYPKLDFGDSPKFIQPEPSPV
tara:strand:- start:574 stop:2811 length:2238 start_codon:yes stop_codon:yes gene_type:complete